MMNDNAAGVLDNAAVMGDYAFCCPELLYVELTVAPYSDSLVGVVDATAASFVDDEVQLVAETAAVSEVHFPGSPLYADACSGLATSSLVGKIGAVLKSELTHGSESP